MPARVAARRMASTIGWLTWLVGFDSTAIRKTSEHIFEELYLLRLHVIRENRETGEIAFRMGKALGKTQSDRISRDRNDRNGASGLL